MADMYPCREVPTEEGIALAHEWDAPFFETVYARAVSLSALRVSIDINFAIALLSHGLRIELIVCITHAPAFYVRRAPVGTLVDDAFEQAALETLRKRLRASRRSRRCDVV